MATLVKWDARSTTAKNLELIQKESGLDSTNLTANGVRVAVPRVPVSENMEWICESSAKTVETEEGDGK